MQKLTGNTSRVLKYLESHEGITSMEAFEKFGATRLSAIIFNLKKYGYNIKSEKVTSKNRYGEKVTFSKYTLIK